MNALYELKRRRLHEYEQPFALLMTQNAEANRDRKKKKDPFTMEDFYLFQAKEDRDIPKGRYGAAAMALIERRLFPAWALFVYKSLKESAQEGLRAPELLAFYCDRAILLAPEAIEGEVKGMLIARKEASNHKLILSSENGDKITLKMPTIDDEVVAIENSTLQILDYEANLSIKSSTA
jgi:hypothetical protein